MRWWKRLTSSSKKLDRDAMEFISMYGEQASELARISARAARNKRDPKRARHYTHVSFRIEELVAAASRAGGSLEMHEHTSGFVAPNVLDRGS